MPEFSASQLINPDFNTEFNQAALQGVQRTQDVGGLNALQGVNLNDPQSVSNAIGNLVKTNNLDKANALIGVQQTRTILPIANQALQDALSDKGQQPAQSQDPHVQVGNHAAETLNMAVKDLNDIKALPSEQRLDAAEALAQKYKERGIDPQAIAGVTSDMSDKGLDSSIASLSNVAQHYGKIANNQPSDYTHEDTNLPQWAIDTLHNNKLNNPVVQGMFKKYLGIDLEPQLQRATQLALPGITKSEEEGHATNIAANTERGKLPYDLIRKEGEAEIQDPREVIKTTVNGVPWETTREKYMQAQKLGMPGLGVGLSPQEEAAQKARGAIEGEVGPGKNLIDKEHEVQEQSNLTSASQKANERLNTTQYDDTALTARQIIGLGNSISTGAYTKDLSDLAQKFAPLLPQSHLSQYATNTTLLSQDLSKAMKAQFAGSALPRIASEFNTITKAVPTNASPQDTVKLYGALMLAKNNMEQDADRHLTQYQQNPTNGRSQTAAVGEFDKNRPDLLAYALPELQKMTINGKPAVEVRKFADPQNKGSFIYKGMFLPGAKNAVQFYIGRVGQ